MGLIFHLSGEIQSSSSSSSSPLWIFHIFLAAVWRNKSWIVINFFLGLSFLYLQHLRRKTHSITFVTNYRFFFIALKMNIYKCRKNKRIKKFPSWRDSEPNIFIPKEHSGKNANITTLVKIFFSTTIWAPLCSWSWQPFTPPVLNHLRRPPGRQPH